MTTILLRTTSAVFLSRRVPAAVQLAAEGMIAAAETVGRGEGGEDPRLEVEPSGWS